MATRTGLEKAALLLSRLPTDAADKVLAELGSPRGERLRRELEKLRQSGNRRAISRRLSANSRTCCGRPDAEPPPPTPQQLAAYRPPSEADLALPEEPSLPALPSDPLRALDVLPPELLATVLQDEQAHTISLVLNALDSEKAGEILRQLTPEMRREVSVRLSRLTSSPPELLARIARALIEKARPLAGKRSDTSGDARYEKMANMLRCLEKAERMEVLTALEADEPETAGRIKSLLYQFEDLLRIHDRSMQKLLSEIDAKTLSVALKGANQEISEKVLKNLSKRARESLSEEMEFLGMVPIAQVREAQKAVVDLIQRLDQTGELMMDE